jgi:hypothetical protein
MPNNKHIEVVVDQSSYKLCMPFLFPFLSSIGPGHCTMSSIYDIVLHHGVRGNIQLKIKGENSNEKKKIIIIIIEKNPSCF